MALPPPPLPPYERVPPPSHPPTLAEINAPTKITNSKQTNTCTGTGDKTVTFLGSHLDVVPANPETWEVDPFHLTRDGDKLYGRGTTDCLGHVAMITNLMIALAEKRPALSRTVLAIFIANEENGEVAGVGVDGLHSSGKLDELGINQGPIFWVDSADSQPCVGTVGNLVWTMKASGKLFHSGLPHMVSESINNAFFLCILEILYMVVSPKDHQEYFTNSLATHSNGCHESFRTRGC